MLLRDIIEEYEPHLYIDIEKYEIFCAREFDPLDMINNGV
jgi:hypothetical protein